MIPIPNNLYDMVPAPVTLKELRSYVNEAWAGRNWHVWTTTEGFGSLKTVSLHVGGMDAQGTRVPAVSFHGRNRQQAMFRARIHLVALLERAHLRTFGYTLEGLNALRGRLGLDQILSVGSKPKPTKGAKKR